MVTLTTNAFEQLKAPMGTIPLLALFDFSQEFVVDIDASRHGIGIVLLQDGHPLACMNKALNPKHMILSVYENEMLA